MIRLQREALGPRRQIGHDCIILSWDKCFRAEVSRQKWGLSFEPVTNGYRLDQPFYHVIPYQHIYQLEKNFYVPQGNVQGSL
jgi:hypothetical protein